MGDLASRTLHSTSPPTLSTMIDVEFKHATLSNGLTIQAEVVPDAFTTAVGFFFRTGARDEDPASMGVSHFLEHMMFKGTDTRSAEDVNRELDDLGANHNAWTTAENTAYYVHTPPESIHKALDVLGDILRPALRSEDFTEEQQVILEEIAMYADQPFWVLYEAAVARYYGENPLSHRVLGTVETVSNLTADVLRTYFDHRYSADNCILAASGNIDFERLVDEAEALCGAWPTSAPTRTHAPIDFTPGTLEVKLPKDTRQRYIMMLCPSVSTSDERRYAAGQAAHCLGDVEGSNLFWSLIEPGLAEEAQLHFDGRDGCGEFAATIVCDPAHADEVEAVALGVLRDASIDLGALERSRAKIETSAMLASERPMGRMTRLGVRWTYGLPYKTLDDDLAAINAVTLDDIAEYLSDYPIDSMLIARGGGA